MKDKKMIALLWILALLPTVMLLLCWSRLPDTIPMHWGLNGQVDGYGSKFSLVIVTVSCVLFAPLFQFLPRLDPKKENYQRFQGVYDAFAMAVLLLMILLTAVVLAESFSPGTLNVGKLVLCAVSILFIFLGCMLGKVKPNWFMGIRTPWALSDPDVWNKTHRLGGWIFFLSGVVTFPLALLASTAVAGIVFFVILIGGNVLTYIMSYYWFRTKNRREN